MGTAPSNSFDTLYRDHHGWLQRWLRRKLGCSHRAADFAHDAFLRVLLRDDAGSLHEPRAYLTTIARGLVIDHYRRFELERAWAESLAALPAEYAPSPEDRQLVIEALLEVDRMLDGLSPRARAAWLYSRIDGLPHAQIAHKLGVSTSRVRQYLATTAKQCYRLRFGDAD